MFYHAHQYIKKKVNTYQYLPILKYCDSKTFKVLLEAWTCCHSCLVKIFDSKCFNCKKGWDCISWLLNQEIYLLPKMTKRGTGKTIKSFQAEWSLHVKSVKYFLPICNISGDSIEKAPRFRSSPFYLWHGNYFIILHKILLGLVYLKTYSGIGFNCLMRKLRKVWEKSKFISSRRSLYSYDSWNPS